MTRLTTIALVTITLLGAGAIMLRSKSAAIDISQGAAAMPSLLELHAAAGAKNLPVQDFEDQALVYPAKQVR